jgi:hypothetical protein
LGYPVFPSKRFRACDLNQPFLLPPSLPDWLPEGRLARFVGALFEASFSRIDDISRTPPQSKKARLGTSNNSFD